MEPVTLGLICFLVTVFSILKTCYYARIESFNCPMASTAFIIPLALFFPLQQFGSFFGQWGNLFLWFALGFAISQNQNWDVKKLHI